ncbi:MAG: ACT domain-containing protein [Chloroflexi bacterium]|nr:ACT domain-containing protein [Chloroflexota bacterium]
MQLKLLPDAFGILKLTPPQPFPDWLAAASVFFVAQTEDEYSIMCPQAVIPAGINYSRDWRCLRAHGDLAFDEIGVVARLSRPLADAGLSLFLISTHDRDYVFVQSHDLEHAFEIYRNQGFSVLA